MSKVPEHLRVPQTSQGRCLCNYCCCSSPLGACQAPNAACHVSSASQASRPAGQHSLDGSVFPGLQDVSCGAVQQQPPCSALPRCWVGAAEPEPMDREAESPWTGRQRAPGLLCGGFIHSPGREAGADPSFPHPGLLPPLSPPRLCRHGLEEQGCCSHGECHHTSHTSMPLTQIFGLTDEFIAVS